jgi:hypothetical protein
MNNRLIIRSYQKLWKWNLKIYALSKDMPLPRALPIRFALYLIVGLGMSFLLFKIPFLRAVPFAIKIVFAVGMAKFLDSVKLDGKNPILFFGGCIRFWLLESGTYLEGFQRYDSKFRELKMYWSAGTVKMKEKEYKTRPIKLCWYGGTRGVNAIV